MHRLFDKPSVKLEVTRLPSKALSINRAMKALIRSLLLTPYGRRHVVFSLRTMSCWIVLQRHRSAYLPALTAAGPNLGMLLIPLTTVTLPMTSYSSNESPWYD